MAKLLKGLPVAQALTDELKVRVEALKARGVMPTLAIVRVGERKDDLSYERGATKRCDSIGIAVKKFVLPGDCAQEELMAAIEEVNADPSIHGCLLFRPLPKRLDAEAVCAALDVAKDVDCITEGSLSGVFSNIPKGFPPCTAEACILLLEHYGYQLSGTKVTVIGRSLVIGKPVSMMLVGKNATVTMCHTRTRDLPTECQNAEILVVATGNLDVVGAEHVREGQVVVDVGINWDEWQGKLRGDVTFEEVEPLVAAITPVPGGVGSVTTAVLAKHVVEAAERTLG